MTRVSCLATLMLCLNLVPAGTMGATEEIPDDEFLEFLGVWDEAWTEACDPAGSLPGDDDACLEYDDEQDESDEK